MLPDGIAERSVLEACDPLQIADWDAKVLGSPGCSFFHTQGWARTLKEAYGYRPVYFAARHGGTFSRLFAFMGIESFITGKRGVSLPFSDYCRPIIAGREPESDFRQSLESIRTYARGAGWRYVEIRDGRYFPASAAPYAFFYRHKLDLAEGEDHLFRRLQGSTRRNIRKAAREGLELTVGTSMDLVLLYFRLHGLARKRHGLPCQPLYFFKSLHKNVISPGNGFVVIASHGGRPVSGAVFLLFGEKAIYKYGASDLAFQHLRGNDLVMWEAIRLLSRRGFQSLCFGRTEDGNEGLRRFKTGWGAIETVIRYYRLDSKKGALLSGSKGGSGLSKTVLSRMPVPALNLIGRILYRHAG